VYKIVKSSPGAVIPEMARKTELSERTIERLPAKLKEKKLFPLVFAFGLFCITVLFVVFKHAFVSGDPSDEDKKLIENIKKEW